MVQIGVNPIFKCYHTLIESNIKSQTHLSTNIGFLIIIMHV